MTRTGILFEDDNTPGRRSDNSGDLGALQRRHQQGNVLGRGDDLERKTQHLSIERLRLIANHPRKFHVYAWLVFKRGS